MRMNETPARAIVGYSARIDTALRLAAAAHHGHVRKGTQAPYVMHPFHVALILDRHGFDEDVVIAGILHDVIEDTSFQAPGVQKRLRAVCPALDPVPDDGAAFRDAVVGYIADTFGSPVRDLVLHVTEKKVDEDGNPLPWEARKAAPLAALEGAAAEVCALKAADCIHNLRSMAHDVQADGPQTMSRFNASPEALIPYYRRVAEIVAQRLGAGAPLVEELREALEAFRAALQEAGICTDS
jgi:(p)ppGpp synthase/HD superfamily hydrolase